MVKALYSTARVAGREGEHWILEFPNQPTRDKADQHRAAVEHLVAETVGSTVPLLLVVEGDGGAPRPARAGDHHDDDTGAVPRPAPPAAGDGDGDDGDDIDVDELTDVPAVGVRTPLDHLAEAFPGSELVDDRDA
jgi:DNA polymerase-3 subunit gamma/tau